MAFHMKFMRHLTRQTGTTPVIIPSRSDNPPQPRPPKPDFSPPAVVDVAHRAVEKLCSQDAASNRPSRPRRVSSSWVGDLGSTVNPINMTFEAKI